MITDYHLLRKAIDESDSEYQDLMRISYLFGVRVSELTPRKKGGDAIQGNNFSEETIEGEDALVLRIPTRRQDSKPRLVAVPLDPAYEEWANLILDLSEKRYKKKLFDIVSRTFQQHTEDYFEKLDIGWYEPTYKNQKTGIYQASRFKTIQTKHFREIRELELALRHKFTIYEIINFFGYKGYMDDKSYFKKLLTRKDIYKHTDIEGAVKLKQIIFNPAGNLKYEYNTYMDIQKMIKKDLIQLLPVEMIDINPNIEPAPKMSDSFEHRILKSNMRNLLLNLGSKNVKYEKANLDVVDHDEKIAVECGKSDGTKLIDVYNNMYQGISNINKLWVVDYYDESNTSKLYKFKFNKNG